MKQEKDRQSLLNDVEAEHSLKKVETSEKNPLPDNEGTQALRRMKQGCDLIEDCWSRGAVLDVGGDVVLGMREVSAGPHNVWYGFYEFHVLPWAPTG